MAVDRGKGRLVNDGGGTARAGDLVENIPGHFRIRKPGKVIMHGNPLAQGFVDRLAQGVVQMRLTTEYEGKAVQGIIAVVHKHLDVLEDASGEVLCFINGQEEGLLFLLVEVENLFLYGLEHSGLAAFWLHSQNGAELAVKFHDADGGEAEVFHVVQVWVKPLGEAAQAEGFPHTGARGEQAYAPCVLEVIEP